MENTTRRQFVAAVVAGCACACCPLGCAPGAEGGAKGKGVAGAGPVDGAPVDGAPVDVGPAEDFRKDGTTDRWAASHGFFMVSRGGRVYAVSSVCTHKNVRLAVAGKADEVRGFKCPRHGSTFDAEGHVTKAPARKSLPRFGITVDGRGHVLVDPATTFGERDWDEPGSFIDVEPGRAPGADAGLPGGAE